MLEFSETLQNVSIIHVLKFIIRMMRERERERERERVYAHEEMVSNLHFRNFKESISVLYIN